MKMTKAIVINGDLDAEVGKQKHADIVGNNGISNGNGRGKKDS